MDTCHSIEEVMEGTCTPISAFWVNKNEVWYHFRSKLHVINDVAHRPSGLFPVLICTGEEMTDPIRL